MNSYVAANFDKKAVYPVRICVSVSRHVENQSCHIFFQGGKDSTLKIRVSLRLEEEKTPEEIECDIKNKYLNYLLQYDVVPNKTKENSSNPAVWELQKQNSKQNTNTYAMRPIYTEKKIKKIKVN
jgi:predicted phosphoadenosine phosphosulfate sulfurtransferase